MRVKLGLVLALFGLVAAGGASAKDWKTIRIGTEGAYPPFNFFDANKELQGFDIDIAKALCARAKVECKFVAQDWDGIIPALLANKYDVIISSMSITDERKKQVDFTDPYYTNALRFVADKKSGIKDVTPKGLAGKTLGVESSTISANYLDDHYRDSTIKQYPEQPQAFLDLANGRTDAVLADIGVSYLWLKSDDGKCCDFVGGPVVSDDKIGMAIRKDDGDLKTLLNKALKDIVADGTYKKINDKYFPFPIF